jgi:hypothetical protein
MGLGDVDIERVHCETFTFPGLFCMNNSQAACSVVPFQNRNSIRELRKCGLKKHIAIAGKTYRLQERDRSDWKTG